MTGHSRYIGRMKQPLQHPDTDNPTMFMITDARHCELDLILLTPGTFLHAYNLIVHGNYERIRIFLPSCGVEYISDIYNLYKELYKSKDIIWVFPKWEHNERNINLMYPKYEGTDFIKFLDGQLKAFCYNHPTDKRIWIRYIKNPYIPGLYDIVTSNEDEVNYFTSYITENEVIDLYQNDEHNLIHVPYSTTMYGGLNYKQILTLGKKHRQKFVPNSFSCVDEFYEANEWRNKNGII